MKQISVTQPDNPDVILRHRSLGCPRSSGISIVNITLLLMGSWLHLIAEASPLPLIAALIYFCVGWYTLLFLKLGGKWEKFIYQRVYFIGFLSAGIAATYRTFSGDDQVDATAFFEIASGAASGLSIIEIAAITEGSLAVVLWREIFDLMAAIGFPRDQYIGVLVNVLIVALSGVVAIKIVRQIYGYDSHRFKMLSLMYSGCGLFWIFSGIFIRDSIILLGVNLLVIVWVYFLTKPRFGLRLILVVIASILASTIFGFMRREFVFVPVAMGMAAIAAMSFGQKGRLKKYKYYLLLTFGLALIGLTYVSFGEAIEGALTLGKEGYIDEATSISNDNSLGMALIVNQSIPIRLVLGSIYLYIFPIPLWSGFQLESSYHLFKSFNVIFMIFLLPLFILALHTAWRNNLSRPSPVMFMLFLVIGFTFAIAGTSLESRHLGVFFVPIFILALLPNLQNAIVRANYWQIFYKVFWAILLVHFAWLFLKFGFIVVIVFLLMLFFLLGMSAQSKIKRHVFMAAALIMIGVIAA